MDESRRSPTESRRGIGCLLALMGLLAVLGFMGLGLASLGGVGGGPQFDETIEEISPGGTSKLVIIEVKGALMPGGVGGGVTQTTLAMLKRAAEDEMVAGVLIRADSPGGSVTDADLLHDRIASLRKKKKKVIVHMGDLCASGCYYFAVAADEIWALPTTVTGSIGVIISNLELGGLLERFGVVDDSITSGRNKQLLSPFRPLTPEQRGLLQGIVDSMYQRFLQIIADGRELEVEAFRGLADGRLLTAEQAKAAKLVDGVDYPTEVLSRLKTLVGEDAYTVVRYSRAPGLGDLLRSRLDGAAPSSSLAELLVAPRPMYLYAPGALIDGLR